MVGDDDLTADEARKVAPFLIGLFGAWYITTIIFNFALVLLFIHAGRVGWPWFQVIPLGAVIWFALRVLKTQARNMADACRAELERLQKGEQREEESERDEDLIGETARQTSAVPSKPLPRFLGSPLGAALGIGFAMLAAVLFWYLVGASMNLFPI